MNIKRIIGVIVLIIGVGAIFVSGYINKQIAEGEGKIEDANKKMKLGKTLFSLTPYAPELTKPLTEGADQKIQEGQGKISYYKKVSYTFRIGGIVCIVVGAGIVILGKKKRSKS